VDIGSSPHLGRRGSTDWECSDLGVQTRSVQEMEDLFEIGQRVIDGVRF
jgi:hypothetical protein